MDQAAHSAFISSLAVKYFVAKALLKQLQYIHRRQVQASSRSFLLYCIS